MTLSVRRILRSLGITGDTFCSGCNLQSLYVIGYRRALAGEPF